MTTAERAARIELLKGIEPCRFCGLDWLFEGNRHDPLNLTGVSTFAGQSRRLHRAILVLFAHVWRRAA